MSFIKADKIKYAYPVMEDFSEDGKDAWADETQKKSRENGTEAEKEKVYALDGVSLEINKGEFIVILGRNGSGKSTLARHLNALLFPEEGTVYVDGMISSGEENIWTIRKNVGMVFQNPDNQIIGSVVDEDVAFGLENIAVPSETIQIRVKDALESVNMTAFAKSSPDNLSGGQKQRVAVAGILAMEPECIVLDEATAMLDPKGREEVMSTALRLNKEKGITIIAITHYMDEALKADKIFVMENGHLLMEGTPKEIFKRQEEIENLGLKLPEVCKLAKKLQDAGLNIPDGITEREELVADIKKLCKDKITNIGQ